ncbi:MAG: substrate-binding domain-containing protein [Litorivicinaceae bacterium]
MTQYLTTKEVAGLLRIKERKVYDLTAKGDIPCVRATGKLLFPEAEIRQWMARQGELGGHRPLVLVGSHDPLLDWALRESDSGIANLTEGSVDGLDRFAKGEGMMAGLHLYHAETGEWNRPWVSDRFAEDPVVLMRFATRVRGLIVASAHAGRIRTLSDLAGLRIATRQTQSGTHVLFQALCQQQGVDLQALRTTPILRSETDAALAVLEGTCDVAFGLQALAQRYSLDFVSVVHEEFDILVDRKAWFDAPFQQFLRFCQGPEFTEYAARLAGYQLGQLGHIRFNGS